MSSCWVGAMPLRETNEDTFLSSASVDLTSRPEQNGHFFADNISNGF